MTNREKYLEKHSFERTLACFNGLIQKEANISCDKEKDCMFCQIKLQTWLDKEYVEPPVDWSEIPIDTKVEIKLFDSDIWTNRYFAGMKDGKPSIYVDGTTSFTGYDIINVFNIRLYEEEENEND